MTPNDHVVIDLLAHACLQEGAKAATAHVHPFPHLSNQAVERRLKRIRLNDADCGILVVSESLFSMDSDVPDLIELVSICRRYQAVLFVDCAHDLGAIGDDGRGNMGKQGVLGEVDIVMGSFSKTFASNGGFVCCQNPSLKLGLRLSSGPLTFTNALSPLQIAVVLKSLDIVQSEEGRQRRIALAENIRALRDGMQKAGFELFGQPSAIVPVLLGGQELSRLCTRNAFEAGAIVNLVEFPAVSRSSSRWRLQVMSTHTSDQMRDFVTIAAAARSLATFDVATQNGAHL